MVTAAQWGKGRIGMQVICLDRLPPHDSKLLGALHKPIVVPHSAVLQQSRPISVTTAERSSE